jgi:serine/threonine protein kinase
LVDEDDNDALAGTVDDSVATDPPASATGPTAAGHGGARVLGALEALPTSTTVGRYEVVKPLGKGGMGVVYLAYDPTLDRPVALKLLHPELRGTQARLLREGQAVAKLAHPNVVRVFDIGTDRDDLFIAMEYVDGWTLGTWLDAERRPPRAILDLFAAAGRGLAAAHGAGLVHRDFKPDNVLVGRDGRVVVTDFGIAKIDADEHASPEPRGPRPWLTMTLTRTGSFLGTPAYMSPEQLRGEPADARSDQFSFCVAHWEALFGARPFALPAHGTLDEVRVAVERGIVPLPQPPPKPLAATEQALRRGLSLDPAERFADMDALLSALAPPRSRDALVAVAAVDEKIAHFRIVARIGQGGMGIVYRAVDEKLGRDVALKVLPGDVVARADRRERFLREARAAAAVVHPAIATDYEVGADGDIPYNVMEYVAGRTLRDVLTSGAMPVPELIRIAIPIADALARAHRAGVVHRDLKPENVMLDAEGAPKILDFGLARLFDPAVPGDRPADAAIISVVTEEGTILGTPAYMSPEQARGRAVDHRSDLFSLGTLLFELVTAHAPFRGPSTMDIATAIIRDNPPAPSSLAAAAPLELDRIILKCLEKDPEDRYQSAAEIVVDLRRLLRQTESGVAVSASTIRAPVRGLRLASRLLAAIAIVTIALTSWAFFLRGSSSSSSHEPVLAPLRPATLGFTERTIVPPTRGDLSGALSPDGTMLALVRDERLTIQDLASGQVRALALPDAPLSWIDWFPDQNHLLLGIAAGDTDKELFALPLDGSPGHAMGIHTWGAAISHGGTRIASFDEGGLRLSALDGSNSRRLVGTRENAEFSWPAWSPDDRWIAYGVRGPGIVPAIRAAAADGSTDVLIVENPNLATSSALLSYVWLGRGRLLYRSVLADSSVLQAIDVDPQTARPQGASMQVGTLPDVVGLESATRDGSRVLYSRGAVVRTEYRAALQGETLELHAEDHQGWAAIGRSADRNENIYAATSGTDQLELLGVGAHGTVRTIASIAGIAFSLQLTPDGAYVIFLEAEQGHMTLRKVSLSDEGAKTAKTIETLPYAPSSPPAFSERLVAQLSCPRDIGQRCILGATEGSDQVFYELDLDRGRGPQVGQLHGPSPWTWNVSPDGRAIIAAHRDGDVRVLDLATREMHQLLEKPGMVVFSAVWIGRTRSVLLAGAQVAKGVIVRVAPNGTRRTLWESTSETPSRLRVLDDAGSEVTVRTTAGTTSLGFLELRSR